KGNADCGSDQGSSDDVTPDMFSSGSGNGDNGDGRGGFGLIEPESFGLQPCFELGPNTVIGEVLDADKILFGPGGIVAQLFEELAAALAVVKPIAEDGLFLGREVFIPDIFGYNRIDVNWLVHSIQKLYYPGIGATRGGCIINHPAFIKISLILISIGKRRPPRRSRGLHRAAI